MTEVIDVLAALREDGAKVKAASAELYKAMLQFDGGITADGEVVTGVRNEYQEARDDALIALEEDHLAREARLPATDIREARVTRTVRQKHPELVARYYALEAQVNLLRRVIANRKTSIGAWQSILRGERE